MSLSWTITVLETKQEFDKRKFKDSQDSDSVMFL